jgi:hypothetical protein
MTLDEIERAIEMLSDAERARLAAWLAELQAAMALAPGGSGSGTTLDGAEKDLESQDKLGNFQIQDT